MKEINALESHELQACEVSEYVVQTIPLLQCLHVYPRSFQVPRSGAAGTINTVE